jgi:hypothetical protein
MWSDLIKPEEQKIEEKVEDIKVIPIVKGEQLLFKREINSFIKEHKYMLDYIYNKYFKDYTHITKKDFYIFAYKNTS